jgi:hypothetical protein
MNSPEAPELTEGTKHDDGKVDMSLLSTNAIYALSLVLTFGKHKYTAHNWRKGIAYSRVIAAAFRHLFAYNGGERYDRESGFTHLAHTMCCIMFLLEYESDPETYAQFNDLWPAVKDNRSVSSSSIHAESPVAIRRYWGDVEINFKPGVSLHDIETTMGYISSIQH